MRYLYENVTMSHSRESINFMFSPPIPLVAVCVCDAYHMKSCHIAYWNYLANHSKIIVHNSEPLRAMKIIAFPSGV